MMFSEKTRLKLALIIIGVIFIEAVLRAIWPSFPFMEAVGAQVGVYGGYAWAKTADNQTTLKANIDPGAKATNG
jgi:hypothetical protein